MYNNPKIRVCLKCRSFMVIHETAENKEKLKNFEDLHIGHPLITTDYSEKDNLECGKITCDDEDERDKLKLNR
ncbi:MAG: hypothetical protein ACTSR8_18430 [Promethearchaeota archaeon]